MLNCLRIARCSLFFGSCLLLVARYFCSLLATFCSLLSARCSLVFARYFFLVTFCSLLVVARCFLLVTFCSLLVTFCVLLVIFSSKLLWNKVTVNSKKNGLNMAKLRHRYFPWKFLRFLQLFLDGGFQTFLNMQNYFQSWHKVTNITGTDITLMSLLQYLNTFLSTFMHLKSQK